MRTFVFAVYYDRGSKFDQPTRVVIRLDSLPNYRELEEIENKIEKQYRWDNVRVFNIYEITDCGEIE